MERSLAVPTATSFRDVPAKLLEVNRKVINGYMGRKGEGKISFTHLIAYAVVRTIADDVPAMVPALLEAVRDPTRARQTAERGRRFVVTHYDWDVLADKLERVWLRCARPKA